MQEEITKHTKKIYHEVKNPQHRFSEKLKEIVIEIFTIVFAITLSIWLHNWSEHRQQQKEVKEFLTDLKNDLKDDVGTMQIRRDSISNNYNKFLFFQNLTQQQMDSLNKTHFSINFNGDFTPFQPDNGDYEGFKSSGKIGYIENKKLKGLILSYYQQNLPTLLEISKINSDHLLKFMKVFAENSQKEDMEKWVLGAEFKSNAMIYSYTLKTCDQGYDFLIKNANQIIAEIDKEQGSKKEAKH